MTLFSLVSFVYDEQITIRVSHWVARLLLGDLAISYIIRPIGSNSTRLIVKLTLPRARGLGLIKEYLLGWLDLFMMRREMLNMRNLAEGRRRGILARVRSVRDHRARQQAS